MRCTAARALFSRELDERIGAAERADLEGHLARCGACRDERDRWSAAALALRASGPSPVPTGLAARAWRAAIREDAQAAPSLAAWFVSAARPAALLGAVAALLVWVAAAAVTEPQQPLEGAGDPLEVAVQLWTAEVPDAR